MKLYIFVIASMFLSLEALASKCSTNISVSNASTLDKTIEFCLTYENTSTESCIFPKTYEISAGQKKEISLSFMCGYPSDPALEEYWVLYRTSKSKEFERQKFNKTLILK
jgi:hypothetical protein